MYRVHFPNPTFPHNECIRFMFLIPSFLAMQLIKYIFLILPSLTIQCINKVYFPNTDLRTVQCMIHSLIPSYFAMQCINKVYFPKPGFPRNAILISVFRILPPLTIHLITYISLILTFHTIQWIRYIS